MPIDSRIKNRIMYEKIAEAVKLVAENEYEIVEGTYGDMNSIIDNWKYKIWIPKNKIKKKNEVR